MAARRLAFAAVLHGRDGMIDRANDGRLGPLLWRRETIRFVGARMIGRVAFAASLATDVLHLGLADPQKPDAGAGLTAEADVQISAAQRAGRVE